ncbi:protein phosphatase 1, regulatory subunit [Rhizophlyctis rosea]|nr:protein phosphatase 1, regulatory subunit [Rhizophlyctis rosea]
MCAPDYMRSNTDIRATALLQERLMAVSTFSSPHSSNGSLSSLDSLIAASTGLPGNLLDISHPHAQQPLKSAIRRVHSSPALHKLVSASQSVRPASPAASAPSPASTTSSPSHTNPSPATSPEAAASPADSISSTSSRKSVHFNTKTFRHVCVFHRNTPSSEISYSEQYDEPDNNTRLRAPEAASFESLEASPTSSHLTTASHATSESITLLSTPSTHNTLPPIYHLQTSLTLAPPTTPFAHTLTTTLHVKNLAFEKVVSARYSFDNWKTYTDVKAVYVTSLMLPSGGGSVVTDGGWGGDVRLEQVDRFLVTLELPEDEGDGWDEGVERVEMCFKYEVRGEVFWDNNFGRNYVVEVGKVVRRAMRERRAKEEEAMSARWEAGRPVVLMNGWTGVIKKDMEGDDGHKLVEGLNLKRPTSPKSSVDRGWSSKYPSFSALVAAKTASMMVPVGHSGVYS